jgi:hypothetical protein
MYASLLIHLHIIKFFSYEHWGLEIFKKLFQLSWRCQSLPFYPHLPLRYSGPPTSFLPPWQSLQPSQIASRPSPRACVPPTMVRRSSVPTIDLNQMKQDWGQLGDGRSWEPKVKAKDVRGRGTLSSRKHTSRAMHMLRAWATERRKDKGSESTRDICSTFYIPNLSPLNYVQLFITL